MGPVRPPHGHAPTRASRRLRCLRTMNNRKLFGRVPKVIHLAAAALATLVLAGCASFSQDGGFGTVDQLTKERVGQAPSYQRTPEQGDAARARVAELLKQPLSADSAVEIALLNKQDLQAGYAELGIAEADLVRAGRLANPTFSFGRLSGNGIVEIDRAVMFDVLGLFTMPVAREVEQQRFAQVQLRAVYDTVGVATQARKAFFEAVAAQRRLPDRAGAAAVRLRQLAGRARRGQLHAVRPAHAGRGRQGALAGARVVLRLPHRLRRGKALPGRGRAAAQADLRREPAALQRHARHACSNCWPTPGTRSPAPPSSAPPRSAAPARPGCPKPSRRPRRPPSCRRHPTAARSSPSSRSTAGPCPGA